MIIQRVILVFVKYPEPGRVKTRLAAKVGDAVAVELYRAFVEDILSMCRSTAHPLMVMVSEVDDVQKTRSWLGDGHDYGVQEGGDLGERMVNAFRRVFERGCRQALLIGSDIPGLPKEILQEGFEALNSGDAVIGPARDGGYYLIGFRSEGFRPGVFEGVEWSTDSVFSRTCGLFAANRLGYLVLPEWDDVDTVDDLRRLFERIEATGGAPRTLLSCRKQVFREDR